MEHRSQMTTFKIVAVKSQRNENVILYTVLANKVDTAVDFYIIGTAILKPECIDRKRA